MDNLYKSIYDEQDEEDDDLVMNDMKQNDEDDDMKHNDEDDEKVIELIINKESDIDIMLDRIKHVDIDKLDLFSQVHESFDDDQKKQWKSTIGDYREFVQHRFQKTLINQNYETDIDNPAPIT